MVEAVKLLFFDTFPHEVNEELNLDLVQFPKPVYITEVRIIPLGARVKADFAGGDRLGATNPSQFNIDFFVNDLGKPGSSFECLGSLEYNQNDCIHLECVKKDVRQIPTDGLVLRGWYTTITLAVYGTLTNGITQSPPEDVIVVPAVVPSPVVEKLPTEEAIWQPPEEVVHPREEVYIEFEPKPFNQPPFHHTETSKDTTRPFARQQDRVASSESDWDRDAEDEERVKRKHTESSPATRASSREISRPRDCSRGYSRSSSSRERELFNRSKRDWSRSPEYRHTRRRTSSYERGNRDASRERDKDHDVKRPRTPPMLSPKRPRTPEQASPVDSVDEVLFKGRGERKYSEKSRSADIEPKVPSPLPVDLLVDSPIGGIDESSQGGEAFEPILSDEEINDDCEGQFDMDYDDNECDEFIKCIDPTTTTLQKCTEEQRLTKELDLAIKIVHKYKLREDAAAFNNFISLTTESKEAWVHCTENFIQILQLIHNFPYYKRNEILEQILNKHIETLVDWVKIGLFCAMSQPQAVYKIRHIKIGARLIELLGCCHDFLNMLLNKEKLNVYSELFKLYYQQNMALSIKLIIIKAIYSCLDLKVGIIYFLNESDTENGYQKLVNAIKANPLTRAKFALKAVLKKVNLFESLELMRDTVNRICTLNTDDLSMYQSDLALLETILADVIKSFTTESIHFSQPKRYLPVSATFEIVKDLASMRSTAATFQSFFDCHALVECILLMISRQHQLLSAILDLCLEMVKALVNTNCGLDYLYNKTDTTGVLVKCLIGAVSDESPDGVEEDIDSSNYKLGIEIVYKIKTKFFLDAIQRITDDNELGETLNLFYSLTSNPIGRHHVVNTISMENNIMALLDVIEREKKSDLSNHSSPGTKIKSPYVGYCIDLIDLTIRNASNIDYLEECGHILLNMCKNHDSFEPTISLVLQEIAIYLKPLEIPNVFQYDDITELCELIKRNSEFVTNFSGELITALRIIKFMTISNLGDEDQVDHHVQLKHKYVVLKFYSADGITTMVSILDKLNSYFEQPAVHMATLASNQGLLATQIICPTVQILRKMLTYVIQSRNTQYKDFTVIEHLLKTFNLMHYVQPLSGAYLQAKIIQEEIVKILLAYTQPTPMEGLDTESVHKSLWTQMIGECIKHILSGPHTFISGLLAFSELLPLPLPVLTKSPLSEAEVTRLITERQLWSAHLHPKSAILTEMIQTICTASYPELLNILRRVCIQLADLAPNMSMLVSKAIVDLLQVESSPSTAMTLRLLKFLSTLIVEPTIKITVLSILPGKLFELLVSALTTPSSSLKLQKVAYGIFEILLDAEVSLLPQPLVKSSTTACALPSKELLPALTSLFVENFLKITNDCSLCALNVMLLMTRYDFTIYLLRSTLDKEKEKILKIIAHLTSSIKIAAKQQFLSIFLDFLLALTTTNTSTNRSFSLMPSDIASILSWPTKNISELYHPLEQLKNAIEPINTDNTLDKILDKLNNLFRILNSASPIDAQELIEPAFPLSEGIVVQFTDRPVYQLIAERTEINPMIQSNYWLGYPSILDKTDDDIELISCDLCELAKSTLPIETNITSDCKRLLHLTASPQSNRERTTAAPCFRTRRVEVEPTTGRPEKKIYVTRGRGFPRTPPTRGDLFRSRPPNTSRPPSLHVDDFLALETCGAQPTGPTGYNKLSRDIISIRGTRGRGRGFVDRGRASAMGAVSSAGPYRQTNRRTNSPSTWQSHGPMEATGPPQHYRTATSEPVGHFQPDYGTALAHFGSPMRGGRMRGSTRPPRTFNRQ